MKLAELAQTSGVPIPSIKYYLRAGLLPAGSPRSARIAEYGPAHLHRLRLIRGMVEVLGVPLESVRALVGVLDDPPASPLATLGATMSELPTGFPEPAATDHAAQLAKHWLGELGFDAVPDAPSARRFGAALALAEDLGIPVDGAQLSAYARAARTAAGADLARVPWGDASAPATAVAAFSALGTVLFEPVLLSLRRLAQAELAEASAQDEPPEI
ncbi:MerR family transcriptional regulator [Leucobacter sp. M11]|uniref:MerR family transcriptional regulator n=1 Tax=Leucobacter sp. M11 TaxID=2993565 RepID=UPI002D7F4B00|nr:MerR family transcriptional regulator [Leucobacter sp. M11]MEB4615272.1 MerR family transcriptional regulator [Leucobacter sp. M11]